MASLLFPSLLLSFLSGWGAVDDHAPIHITSDADFETPDLLSGNGVRGGSGTPDDPYVISDWRIRTQGTLPAVQIMDTTVHVRLENLVLVAAPTAERVMDLQRNGHLELLRIGVADGPSTLVVHDVASVRIERLILERGDLYVAFAERAEILRNQLGDGSIHVETLGTTIVRDNQVAGEGHVAININHLYDPGGRLPTSTVEGNRIHGSFAYGLSLVAFGDGRVCGNLVEGVERAGITILGRDEPRAGSEVVVCGNLVEGTDRHGLEFRDARGYHILENTLRQNGAGMFFVNVTGTVERNVMDGNTYGVNLVGDDRNPLPEIRHNILLHNAWGAWTYLPGPFDMTHNYWGTASDPKATGEATGVNRIEEAVLFAPWCIDPACEALSDGDRLQVPGPGLGFLFVATGSLAAAKRAAAWRQKT